MTDVTITISSPITLYAYVTYYSLVLTSNTRIVLQTPVLISSLTYPAISTASGFGTSFGPLSLVTFGVGISVFEPSTFAFVNISSIVPPIIGGNNRSFGSSIDNSQSLIIRTFDSEERVLAVKRYLDVDGDTNNMSTSDRQIFARNISSIASSSKDSRLVISSLVSNYAHKIKPVAITNAPVKFRTI